MAKSPIVKKIMLFGYIAVFAGLILTFWGVTASMKIVARTTGENAANVFHKDPVESLLLLIDSDRHSSKEKNNAIWALGVLKDTRALAPLEALTADKQRCGEEKLCIDEIEKSILKIKGRFVISWPKECDHR